MKDTELRHMKVVHMTTGHTPFDIRVFGRECKTIAQRGCEVTLIVPCTINVPEKLDGIRFQTIPKPKGRLQRMTVAVWRAFWKAARQNADVYHFHDTELMFAGLGLRLLGKTVVYDVHEDVPAQIRYSLWVPRMLRPLVAWLYTYFERFASGRFNALVAANSQIYDRVHQYNPNTVLLRNYPVKESLPYADEIHDSDRLEEDFFGAYQNHRDHAVIVNFGGINPQTCIQPIVEAMELIPTDIPLTLVLGGCIVSPTLLERMSQLPGWKRVIHRGRIQRTEMMRELRRAAAALTLYSPDPNHLGVGSNRLFESMATGIPVITPNFQNWKALVETIGCGIAVNPMDPEQIAGAITYILSHPLEAREMGARGRAAIVSELNWDREKHKLIELYDRLLPRVISAPVAIRHCERT